MLSHGEQNLESLTPMLKQSSSLARKHGKKKCLT